MRFSKNYLKNRFRFGQVKYNTIYTFGENNESGIPSRQVPVWRGLISIVLSVINSGPNNYYGIDSISVCTGSGMYRLHCIYISLAMKFRNTMSNITFTQKTNQIYLSFLLKNHAIFFGN